MLQSNYFLTFCSTGGPWTDDEHRRFEQGLKECGHNWSKIAKEYVKTRVRTQVASHAQKYFQKQKKLFSSNEADEDTYDEMQQDSSSTGSASSSANQSTRKTRQQQQTTTSSEDDEQFNEDEDNDDE